MKHILSATALLFVAVGAILAADVTAPRSDTKDAPNVKPHHYTVSLSLRESVDGLTYDITSLSLPVEVTDGMATVQMKSGKVRLSVTAEVTGELGSEEAQALVSLRRNGKEISFPKITVLMGQVGRMQMGDRQNGYTMDVTLNRG